MLYFCQLLDDYILDVFTEEDPHPEDIMDIMESEYNFFKNRGENQLVKVDNGLDTWVYEDKKYIDYDNQPEGTTIEDHGDYLVLKCKRYLDTIINLGGN